MKSPDVRINRLTLHDMKSVGKGTIEFQAAGALRQKTASILGLYGQNGSGKTVAVEALDILKSIFTGVPIHPGVVNSITKGKSGCSLELELSLFDEEDKTDCTVFYSCTLEPRDNPNKSADDSKHDPRHLPQPDEIIVVAEEILKVSGLICATEYNKRGNFAKSNENDYSFLSKFSREALLGGNEKILEGQRSVAFYGGRSFLFSKQLWEAMRETEKTKDICYLFKAIRYYAALKLFVIEEKSFSGLLFLWCCSKKRKSSKTRAGAGPIPFFLGRNKTRMGQEMLEAAQEAFAAINVALVSLIPGLQILCKAEKRSLDESDSTYEVELFSWREGFDPFSFDQESLGVKKIVSILSVLIAAYHDPGFTLVVDELDASIFEFLLGELISVLKESGRGQLIFTSHNLRPLEMLDAQSICFTTTNPQNRYMKLSKSRVKDSSNLRKTYFRTILLGGEDEALYHGDSKAAIEFAFEEAGWGEQ